MSLIKQVEDLKSSGRSDSQIVSDLRSQGFMPREIEDALSQFQVKNAVSQEYNSSNDNTMQQSIMSSQSSQIPSPSQNNFSPPIPSPISQSQQGQGGDSSQSSPDQNYYEGYSSGVSSDSYPQYSYSQPSGSEAFSEIAEQVFDQKIVKIKSELSKMSDFNSDADNKISLLKERIKRIESIIDSLQDSIVRKIGEYGQNIQDLGNDLKMTQDSFSKVVEPLSKRMSYSTPRVRRPRARKKSSKKKVVKK